MATRGRGRTITARISADDIDRINRQDAAARRQRAYRARLAAEKRMKPVTLTVPEDWAPLLKTIAKAGRDPATRRQAFLALVQAVRPFRKTAPGQSRTTDTAAAHTSGDTASRRGRPPSPAQIRLANELGNPPPDILKDGVKLGRWIEEQRSRPRRGRS